MKKGFLAITFVVYLVVVAAITIVPTRLSGFRIPSSNHINVVPFAFSIKCFRLAHNPHHGLMPFCLLNLFGNIALFLPFGILLPLVSGGFRSFKRVVLVALCLSVSIETIQFVLRFVGNPRAVDIEDVLLNTLGTCLGFVVYRYVIRVQSTKSRVQNL